MRIHVKQGRKENMAELVFNHVWDSSWNGTGKVVHTDSRYAQPEFFTGLHRRGCSGTATVTLQPPPKKRKKADMSEEADTGSQLDDDEAAAERSRKVCPFPKPPAALKKVVPRGWCRRAQRMVEVPRCSPMKLECMIIRDSGFFGLAHTAYCGEVHGVIERMEHGEVISVDSSVAHREHNVYYGGVDRTAFTFRSC